MVYYLKLMGGDMTFFIYKSNASLCVRDIAIENQHIL